MDHSSRSLLRPDFLSDLASLSGLLHDHIEAAPSRETKDFGDLTWLGDRLSQVTGEVRLRAQRAAAKHFEAFPQTPLGTPISLFGTLGFHREEVAHTRALAWLLDSRQPHGFGTSLLDALVDLVQSQANDEQRGSLVKIHARGVRHVEAEYQLTARRRIDIFVEGGSPSSAPWRLLIEAKVDAGEGFLQLADYGVQFEEAAYVYLTPTGRLPQDSKDASRWIPVSFADLAKAFLETAPHLVAKPGYGFLQMYLVGIVTEFCGIQCPVHSENTADQPFAILHVLDEIDD